MAVESLTTLCQESLLCLMAFDPKNGRRVRTMVHPDVFDNGVYRRLATKLDKYWQSYNEPPQEHLIDLVSDVAEGDARYAKDVQRLYESMLEAKEGINPKYVISQVSGFLREQRLRAGILSAAESLEAGKVSDAEDAMRKSLQGSIDVFNPGLLLSKVSVEETIHNEVEAYPTGIKELDAKNLGPTPSELHIMLASYGRGKSWFLMHLAKKALAYGKKVLYVTLEMSEKRVAQRFIQAFCSVTRRPEEVVTCFFEEDSLGRFSGFRMKELKNVRSFADEGIERILARKMKMFRKRSPLVIKNFPTGTLTVRELEAYLDSLEASIGFKPDLLCLDYLKLLKFNDAKNFRLELDMAAVDLRGLAASREIAVDTVMQVNREWSGKKLIMGQGVSEDWGLMGIVDVALTYNQTEDEHAMNIARLYVDKGRNEADRYSLLISQNYAIGQFALSSCPMTPTYWKLLKEERGQEAEEQAPRRKRRRLEMED